MFTVSILLTFVVFSILLSPMMPASYLSSPSNIFLHNITPILAVIDFVLCDFHYESKNSHLFCAIIMPLLYVTVTLIISLNGVRFGKEIVPYFFLNYEKFGWITVNQKGIGVLIWILLITVLLLGMGAVLLKLKDIRKKYML